MNVQQAIEELYEKEANPNLSGVSYNTDITHFLSMQYDHRHGDWALCDKMIDKYLEFKPDYKIFAIDNGSDQICIIVAPSKEYILTNICDNFDIEEVVS